MSTLSIVAAGCNTPEGYFNGSSLSSITALPSGDMPAQDIPIVSPSPTPSCQTVLSNSTSTTPLKIIFMEDNSGSANNGRGATDPAGTWRIQTIQSFLSTYGSQTNLSYSFGYFSTNAYLWDMGLDRFGKTSVDMPFGTASGLGDSVDYFGNHLTTVAGAGGSTNYKQAFAALETAILADEAAGNKEDYAIVFLSDGQPSDLGDNATKQLNGIASLVSDLQATAASNGVSKATISAVYFGPQDATAIANLQSMAKLGGGQFDNAPESGSLVLENVITVPTSECVN
jgi:hypothetical protein